ncbi:MAG: RnfABCDGE type electron transport complex subunit B [Candidatus Omnitrophota bacterium]
MNSTILYSILLLTSIGILSAVVLYFIAKKFKVVEDPRIDEIEKVLPGANCGACGYPGCRNFAEICIKADDLSSFYCAVGGNECMAAVAKILGKEAVAKDPLMAVVRCGGAYAHRKKSTVYDGVRMCAVSHNFYIGETDCAYGCLGLGDCVTACPFGAISMDPSTGLPVISEEKCVACGACVTACPRLIIELRKKGPKGRRVFVSCMNKDKGAAARKICAAACIACGQCVKACPFDAIKVENFLAYIDFNKCKLCRKCVDVCPTGAILEVNFPARTEPKDDTAQPAKTEA